MAVIVLFVMSYKKKSLRYNSIIKKKMQPTKCIFLLQKHVTETAPFDFQIFKTARDK